MIELQVAGPAFHHSLPVAMWDSGGEAEPGTRELLEVLDDPLEKLTHWMYEGASLLRLAPDNLAACARWISLFGIAPEEWPRSLWYRLALLLLDLPSIAGSEEAVKTALERVLGLPVNSSSFRHSLAVLKHPTKTRLGERASRIGLDFIVGDAFYDMAHLRVEIGPVPLATYEKYLGSEGRDLLDRLLALVLPVHLDYELRWVVLDPEQAPRLGIAERNCRLQINSYLGKGCESAGSL
jgi:predicted component of type VI protein secretion system